MTHYRHTQIGWLILIVMGSAVALLAVALLVIAARLGPSVILIAVIVILIAGLVIFSTLTVEVTDEDLRFHFTFGLFGRRIPLAAIASCVAVENSLLYGWGIRAIPGGWLYNVSGTKAVELRLRDGRLVRVGSDEPARICDVLRPLIQRFASYPTVGDPFSVR